jgi:hypothetical protein
MRLDVVKNWPRGRISRRGAGSSRYVIDPSKSVVLDIAEDVAPELHALADGQGVGVWGTLLRARQDVQPAEHNCSAPFAVPAGQRERAGGERQVDGDADDPRKRPPRRRTLE